MATNLLKPNSRAKDSEEGMKKTNVSNRIIIIMLSTIRPHFRLSAERCQGFFGTQERP